MSEVKQSIIGLERADLTDEVWQGVAEAYVRSAYQLHDDETVSSRRWFNTTVDDIERSYGEFRFGSTITLHSKLLVCDMSRLAVHFTFDAHAEPHELTWAKRLLGVTPESIQADFSARQAAWLGELGLAREITDCYHAR
ncbi:MAG TPA: hypothetical protein VN031_01830 [Candidatus Microsaccharimonas sp.]|nr:hypothetical protein [Candidatus Microsaccharimonas sp.]